ncbi:MAG: ketoacyl-ACP synthase III, partial [Candidatus Omnitrophica bacterium]|nr:ketoacyl-ACP synthase III [Candidatus Omnitrophota bacterium]
MRNVGIVAVGKYLPEKRLTNFDLEKIVETTDEWIRTRTGISERRIAAENERTSDLAVNAAKDVIRQANIDPASIDLILVATISPDSNFPSMACLVQKALGAHRAVAFDISAACSGFLYAMTTAKQFIQTGLYSNALVIASERITKLIDWKDRSTCVLFGDGAGACLLAPVDGSGIVADFMHSQGEFSNLMEVVVEDYRAPDNDKDISSKLPYVVMQGQELFKIAVNSMAEAVEEVLKKAGLTIADVDCVVPHQANDRIISAVAKKLD